MKYKMIFVLCFTGFSTYAQNMKPPCSGQKPKTDWAAFTKYAAQNATIPSPEPGEQRVVFLGSSVFEFWKSMDPSYFSENNYIDRGISGQISPQLLVRFRADVIDLKPQAVVILAGSNDIAHDTTCTIYKRVMDNIKSMTELAEQNNIQIILCKYVPISDYPWRRGLHPGDKIIKLNKLITEYAKKEGLILLDYYTPLVNGEKGQKKSLTKDGVHPNLKGYKIMEAVTDKAIAKALK